MTELVVPFGKAKGTPIEKLEDDSLCWHAAILRPSPLKDAAVAEVKKRGLEAMYGRKVAREEAKARAAEEMRNPTPLSPQETSTIEAIDNAAAEREAMHPIISSFCPHCKRAIKLRVQ